MGYPLCRDIAREVGFESTDLGMRPWCFGSCYLRFSSKPSSSPWLGKVTAVPGQRRASAAQPTQLCLWGVKQLEIQLSQNSKTCLETLSHDWAKLEIFLAYLK